MCKSVGQELLQLLPNLISAIIGGLIGGFFSWLATTRAIKHDRKKAVEAENRFEKGLLQALYDEINISWNRYVSQIGIGFSIESVREGEALLSIFPIGSNSFPIYLGNTSSIGKIHGHEIRRLIVAAYTEAAGMLTSISFNNELVNKYMQAQQKFKETRAKEDGQAFEFAYSRCVSYTSGLKTSHQRLKTDVPKLLVELQNELNNPKFAQFK